MPSKRGTSGRFAVAHWRSLGAAAGADGLVVLVGALVTLGWLFGVGGLKSLFPGLPEMKANTAVCFILLGASVRLLRRAAPRPALDLAALAAAGTVLAAGVLSFGEDAFGWSLGLDELLFHDGNPVPGTAPGRMAANTAVAFVLAGTAILLRLARRQAATVEFLGVLVGAIGLFALVGYLYGVRLLQSGFVRHLAPMALSSACALVLLAWAILAAGSRGRLMTLASSRGPGGVLIRRFVVPSVALALFLGWLRLEATKHAAASPDTASALYVLVTALAAAALILFVARTLERVDSQRRLALRRSVEALRSSEASERKFRGLVEASPDAIVITDAEGRILLVNRLTEQLLGYRRDELIGEAVEVLVPAEARRAHHATRTEYSATANPEARVMGGNLELSARHKDGSVIPVEIGLAPVQEDGNLVMIATLRDITQRKQAAAEIAAAHEQRRQLLAKLIRAQEEERRRIAADVHDDPVQVLTALTLHLEMVQRKSGDPDLLDDAVTTSRSVLERLRHLIFEVHPPALDRDGLIPTLDAHLTKMQDESGIVFELRHGLSEEPPTDTRAVVYRIAQEALANAAKHARAQTVAVTVETVPGGVQARVADDGRGFRFDPATPPPPGHLGLVTMRERAELAGGWCRIDTDEGGPTIVEFFVPNLD